MSGSSAFGDGSWGDANGWHRAILALGALLVVAGVGKAVRTVIGSGGLLEATLDLLLLGAPGLVMLYVGAWLPTSTIVPRLYPRIVAWTAGGVAVMGLVLGLRVLHPGVEVQFTFGTQAVLLATGSIAGLAAGVNESQALTHSGALEERNEELKRAERRLAEAVTQLEESNEQLEQFAYAASHDLQEPLRMVTKYLQLVERRYGDDLDEDCTEFIEFAVDGADRMREMVDRLLEYSRVDAGVEPFEPVDLDAVFDDVLTDLQFKIERTDAEITREPLPTVEGDARQLQRVFQNLVTNAIEYSGEEPPRIRVTAKRDGGPWTVSVRDEGVGIDPDDVDRIFGIFQRLHSTDESGSGIGLALCERIVERHGGEIRVDSEPGEGSTFSVTLPPRAEPQDAPGVARTEESDSRARS